MLGEAMDGGDGGDYDGGGGMMVGVEIFKEMCVLGGSHGVCGGRWWSWCLGE